MFTRVSSSAPRPGALASTTRGTVTNDGQNASTTSNTHSNFIHRSNFNPGLASGGGGGGSGGSAYFGFSGSDDDNVDGDDVERYIESENGMGHEEADRYSSHIHRSVTGAAADTKVSPTQDAWEAEQIRNIRVRRFDSSSWSAESVFKEYSRDTTLPANIRSVGHHQDQLMDDEGVIVDIDPLLDNMSEQSGLLEAETIPIGADNGGIDVNDDGLSGAHEDVARRAKRKKKDIIDKLRNDDEEEAQRRHHREMRQVKRIFKTRHLLKRSTRCRLWCAKLWSCERLAFAMIIAICGICTILASLYFVGYVEYEWRHTLDHGICRSRNCSQVVSPHITHLDSSDRAQQSSQRPTNAVSTVACVCDMYFDPFIRTTPPNSPNASDTDMVPSSVPNGTTFREVFVGYCPQIQTPSAPASLSPPSPSSPPHGGVNEQFRHTCWRNPASEIWLKYPNLWIIKVMAVVFSVTLALVMLCFMFVSTGQANVISHIEDGIVQSVLRGEDTMNRHGTTRPHTEARAVQSVLY